MACRWPASSTTPQFMLVMAPTLLLRWSDGVALGYRSAMAAVSTASQRLSTALYVPGPRALVAGAAAVWVADGVLEPVDPPEHPAIMSTAEASTTAILGHRAYVVLIRASCEVGRRNRSRGSSRH